MALVHPKIARQKAITSAVGAMRKRGLTVAQAAGYCSRLPLDIGEPAFNLFRNVRRKRK